MIAGLRGNIVRFEDQAVIVDLHGFQLRVMSSGSTLETLGGIGEQIELQTQLVVREDSLTLYGFASAAELQLFELLLGVNGVGPRVALNLLSFSDPATLYSAIANEDTALLAKTPGVGKVTAGRIILDLKRKLPDDFDVPTQDRDDRDHEAVAALEALGYSTSEARSGLSAIVDRTGMSTEERIFAALRNMDEA